MKKRGEITVFLSMVLICVCSLLLGLWESARTAGARLYLRTAADSALDSVLGHYNRNLWDMYQLLFLEYEDTAAIEESCREYLDFYLDQKNFYPMKLETLQVKNLVHIQDQGGKALEQEAAAYVKYRLPELVDNTGDLESTLKNMAKAGNFKRLITACRQAGRGAMKLEKKRRKLEDSLKKQRKYYETASEAVDGEQKGRFRSEAGKLRKEMGRFPGYVREYETELEALKQHRIKLESEKGEGYEEDESADVYMEQELSSYRQVEAAGEDCLKELKDAEEMTEAGRIAVGEALELFEETEEGDGADGDGEEENDGCDWGAVGECWSEIEIPQLTVSGERDEEKANALERLEGLLDQDLLSLVLPRGTEVSGNRVSLQGALSAHLTGEKEKVKLGPEILFLNAYIRLYFDNFLHKTEREKKGGDREQPLLYEQEYLLSGKASDRENLKGAVEQLMALRGALNLLYLLSDQEKKAEADGLAAAVAVGSPPLQVVISFFILSLWAFGESIADLKILLAGGKVPAWKDAGTWKLNLSGLLQMEFLEMEAEPTGGSGWDYGEYLQILLCLLGRQVKNYRMLDVIQWNVRRRQADFAIESCAYRVEVESHVLQRHFFLIKEEYETAVLSGKSY